MFTSSILVVLCITSLVAAVQQQQKPSPFVLKSFEMTPVVAAPQAAGGKIKIEIFVVVVVVVV